MNSGALCAISGKTVSKLFVSILVLSLLSAAAWAQVTASISGTVRDKTEAVIPNATVTVTSAETGSTRIVHTDTVGSYRILSLPVGRYEIKAEQPGFHPETKSGINLTVGQEAVVNFALEPGVVTEAITVTAEAEVINTTTSSVSGLVGEQQVKDLPLNGRSFDNLITLNAGTVNIDQQRTAGGLAGVGNVFSISGRRYEENLFLLNGVEYTGATIFNAMPGGVSGQTLGIDAIREFNVIKDTYGAEYGKRSSGQIAVVTMSGTNQFHGSAFEFLRNSALDARNFFDKGNIPPFRRNNFGASAGGPIQKDRTFIFGNYEGFRQRLGLSSVAFVPDLNARQGLLPTGPGGSLVNVGVAPGVAPYFALWPAPNGPNLGGGIAQAFSNPKQAIREDFFTVRADHTFSPKDSLNGVYTFDDGSSFTPLLNPLTADTINLRSQVASLQEVHIFSSSLINSLTLGFSRSSMLFSELATVDLPPAQSFIQGRPVGQITIGGGLAVGGSTVSVAGAGQVAGVRPARTFFAVANNLQWNKGIHLISAGVSVERLRVNDVIILDGQAVFSTLATFLQGQVSLFQGIPIQNRLGWRSLEGAWYLQDTIKLRSNLTLNLGLRHEFTNGWTEEAGRASNFVPGPDGVLLTEPRVADSLFTKNNSIKLFEPRAGLAWDPFGTGKTSIHAGFGIYYNLFEGANINNTRNKPFNTLVALSNQTLPLQLIPGVAFPGAAVTPGGIKPDLQMPAVVRYTFRVEQAIGGSMGISAGYVGSRGYHLGQIVDVNTAIPQILSNGTKFFPLGVLRRNPILSSAAIEQDSAVSYYNALELELTRRFSQGLQFRANYTFAKSIDTNSGLSSIQVGNTPQAVLDPADPQRDRGLSAYDIRHRFSLSAMYELPIGQGKPFLGQTSGVAGKLVSGWQVNAIVNAQSGFPFTPILGFNNSRSGDVRAPDRPNFAPGITHAQQLSSAGPNLWFDPHQFVLPAAGTFGNVGRTVLTAPNQTELDMSLFKTTKISERASLQFRFEAFNLLNHANFGIPNNIVSSPTGAIPGTAGVITRTVTSSRQIQFGLKLIW